jgi:hypothetical protein
VTLSINTLVGQSADYVIRVIKLRRPQYNIGAPTLSETEPILADTTYRGSLHHFESGQYFRLTLLPGQSFYTTGAVLSHEVYGTLFTIEVFDTASVMRMRILNLSMSGLTRYQSSSFTNPNTTPTDFIIRLYTKYRPAHDFSLNFWIGGEQPILKLFLNVNDPEDPDDFDPASPEDEAADYLPCGRVDKTSEAAPPVVDGVIQNYLKVIAAYVASNGGRVVAPPPGADVSIVLMQTSNYPGMAMNLGTSTQADFSMPEAGPFPFNALDYASADLHCLDYGGRTVVSATRGTDSATMQLPKDTNPANSLPDTVWKVFERAWDSASSDWVTTLFTDVADEGDPGDDEDNTPTGNNAAGDNLTRFEEFRGFLILGRHFRTSPTHKDVFVRDYGPPGVADAAGIPLRWHDIFAGESSSARRINFNSDGLPGQPSHVDQQAVLIYNGGEPETNDRAGETPCFKPSPGNPFVCYPNIIGVIHGGDYQNTELTNNVQVFVG